MNLSFLQLNSSKTELFLFCPPNLIKNCSLFFPLPMVLGSLIPPAAKVRNLGVLLESNLSLQAQANAQVSSCFFQLKLLARAVKLLSIKNRALVIGMAIHSRLDYCNALLAGAPESLLDRLQSVQNAAARLVLGLKRRESTSSGIRGLHWLRVRDRIFLKLGSLAFKCLYNQAPPYLTDRIHRYVPGRALRSGSDILLVVPKFRRKTLGRRRIGVVIPQVWNSIPQEIRLSPDLTKFKKNLKTWLFMKT